MTFEALSEKLNDAKYNVSLAYNNLAISESMATSRPCALVEKSIEGVENALEFERKIRAEMGKFISDELLEMSIRAGLK